MLFLKFVCFRRELLSQWYFVPEIYHLKKYLRCTIGAEDAFHASLILIEADTLQNSLLKYSIKYDTNQPPTSLIFMENTIIDKIYYTLKVSYDIKRNVLQSKPVQRPHYYFL